MYGSRYILFLLRSSFGLCKMGRRVPFSLHVPRLCGQWHTVNEDCRMHNVKLSYTQFHSHSADHGKQIQELCTVQSMYISTKQFFFRFPPYYSQSPLRLALRFIFLKTHATSYSFFSSLTLHCKWERRKNWQKTTPPSLWFKKSIQKHQVRELLRLCPETSTKLNVHEFGFRRMWVRIPSVNMNPGTLVQSSIK